MDNDDTSSSYDQYRADMQSIIDSYVKSIDSISPIKPHESCTYALHENEGNRNNQKDYRTTSLQNRKYPSSSSITLDRDPARSDHLTDEVRWLLIQDGPYQPRDDDDHFQTSVKSTQNGKGIVRFRVKWFDDIRFSDWLEYSLTTCRAYCFYCRLFADSNRNRAFSRDGIKNWRKCLGSRGQKKKRSIVTSDDNNLGCQRRGLLESHAMSESHKQAYNKYLQFLDQRNTETQRNDDRQQNGDINILHDIKQENNM
ncbi:unnamed protein product [Adineta steineri]|uniref:TTF-type domain-containing protein n=1 Tax=Adineta steineri TaxID=433720 RepID=A0A818LAB9_9BILA|nr:unnamed protein product [Adineta steineri]CAF3563216.1 unnamed protein product [Adineta steineri]